MSSAAFEGSPAIPAVWAARVPIPPPEPVPADPPCAPPRCACRPTAFRPIPGALDCWLCLSGIVTVVRDSAEGAFIRFMFAVCAFVGCVIPLMFSCMACMAVLMMFDTYKTVWQALTSEWLRFIPLSLNCYCSRWSAVCTSNMTVILFCEVDDDICNSTEVGNITHSMMHDL